jgi:Secretion system C-terminal sorting domain/Calx-beta domain
MKKLFTTLFAFIGYTALTAQNGPGLIISEALPNPAGTDSPFEFVELVATRTINFSVTPYTVVVCNNGTGSALGWTAGGALSYGFEISSGTVNAGDIVYVGGSSMAVTGTILRSVNTGTTGGDGFGNAGTGGVFGNGGGNADGIAVFASPVAALTSSSVPADAIFFGTGTGTSVVNAGADGYQLPVNDLYPGGKLQASSFLAPDPASAQTIIAAGTFNPVTGSFTSARSFTIGAFTDIATSILLSSATASPTLSFATTNQTVNESAGTATVTVNIANPNNAQVVVTVSALAFSNATAGTDYTISPSTLVIPANTATPQTITVTLTDDALAESDEYIGLSFSHLINGTASATAAHFLYIKDNDTQTPVASNELFLDLLGSFSNGSNATNSAEIVVHDPATQRLYIANSIGAKLDIINFSNPATPSIIASIPVTSYGNINSVAVRDSIVALAIENGTNPQDSGKIVFLNYNGVFISQVNTSAMPDMITFNHAGTKVIAACEGEPNTAYTNDPDGAIAVVDISGGVANVTQANCSHITFTSFNGQEAALRAQGIRIYGLGATASKDFEPEYITISDNDQTAWVTLQENNAIAVINLQTNTVTQILPLGYKNHNVLGNGMDVSDQTAGINLSLFPVKGMYLPDAISQYTVGNQTYLITANEGDARAYTGFNEESRISGLTLDPVAFPQGAFMKSNLFMGRLNATNKTGDTDNDGDIDEIYVYGSRSFSIWNATTGAQVFDSGDQLERITSTHPTFGAMFNASNSTSPAAKNRSDDKGPEPEGTVTATINGEHYAFVALERIGGVMMYNITSPAAPVYVGYYNNRSVASNGPDRGSEGIFFIPDSLSPNGQPLLLLANETSSTLTIFQITTCAQRTGVAVTPATSSICQGSTQVLTGNTVAGTTYQWIQNGSNIAGETNPTYTAATAGSYQLFVTSTANVCSGKTNAATVIVNPAPVVTASTTAATLCTGNAATISATGAATYNWMPGNLSGASVSVTPAATTTYTVTGTNAAGCTNTSTVAVTVNALPTVAATTSAASICAGSTAILNATGAATYNWMPGNISGSSVTVTPASTQTYTLTGTDGNGCANTSTVAITVNALPTVAATTSAASICAGSTATVSGTGAATYNWMPGNLSGNSVTVNPAATTTYTVTGTDANGCINTSTVAVTVNALPTVTATASANTICNGSPVTLSSTGATTYNWMPGSLSGSSVNVTPSATTTYTVTGINAAGCTNTSTITIAVSTTPTVTATTQATTICSGSNVTLSSSGATSYMWIPGNLLGSSVTVNPTANTTYTVTGTNAAGCTNTATVTITSLPRPTIAATAVNNTICSGNAISMTATGGSTYTWLPGLLTGSTVTDLPSASTTYTVTGVGSNGCNNTATVAIAVNASPVVTATSSASAICGADSVVFTASGAISYNWLPANISNSAFTQLIGSTTTFTVTGSAANGCTDSTNVTVTVNSIPVVSASISSDTLCINSPAQLLSGQPAGGVFSGPGVSGNLFDAATAQLGSNTVVYTFTDNIGCQNSDSIQVVIDVCTGVTENQSSGVTIYPNPFTEQLFIKTTEPIQQIEFYDISGKLLKSANVSGAHLNVETQELPAGVYILRITHATSASTHRVIKS